MSKRRVTIIVTQDCQLRCKYCYLVGKNKKGKMTWETATKIVDFLMSMPVTEDTVIFDFIGGEPLLEIELIQQMSDYIVKTMESLNHPWINNYSFRITTNGLNYSSPKVQHYIEQYKEHLSVQISFDGIKQKHDLNRIFLDGSGSYDKILPNVKLWINQFKDKAMSFMVVSHEDLPYLSKSIFHLIQLGIKDIAINFVVENVWQSGDDRILEDELMLVVNYLIEKRLWKAIQISILREEIGTPEKDDHILPCGNPMYVFDSSGNIYTCVRFVDYSLRTKKPRIIGTLETGIDRNKIKPLLLFSRKAIYPAKCLNCEIATGCRWCPAENYDASISGTIFQRTTTTCDLHKANVRVKNYYWNKIKSIETDERCKAELVETKAQR